MTPLEWGAFGVLTYFALALPVAVALCRRMKDNAPPVPAVQLPAWPDLAADRERIHYPAAEVVATILACGCAITYLPGGRSQVARCAAHVWHRDMQAWERELAR